MAGSLDYRNLYSLQDRVLSVTYAADTGFYLTGGTCLHRFYAARRYSDDLDLFCPDVNLFRDYARELQVRLGESGHSFRAVIDSRDFIRLDVEGSLKVDLVNDRVYRHGRSRLSPEGYKLDNLENLLANELCAVIWRDEPKDVFDIFTISGIAP